MKELDEETLARVEKAVRMEHDTTASAGNHLSLICSVELADCIMAELHKTEPEFAEGEAYAWRPANDAGWTFMRWDPRTGKGETNIRRRLTQKEQGPYLIALVDAVAEFVDKRAISFEMLDELSRRLDAYNEAHSDE